MTKKSPVVAPKIWKMEFHDSFVPEFKALDPDVRKALLAVAKAVSLVGPTAGRPTVDSLSNPPHPNLKEMRFDCKNGSEVWRVAFAFDQNSDGVILCAGDKQGVTSSLFYKRLLAKANKRLSEHIKAVKDTKEKEAIERKKTAKTDSISEKSTSRKKK